MSFQVLLCGVGGQGTILAAHILADAVLREGKDVKVSEIHGMSQRGGSVVTVVTLGDDVSSMVSYPGSADIMVSFDMLEALRYLEQLSVIGSMVVSDEVIRPTSVLTGIRQMPSNLRGSLQEQGAMLVPAESTAKEIGNPKVSNMVLLGALSKVIESAANGISISERSWEDAIAEHVPAKTVDSNILAFKAGSAFASEH